MPRCGDHDDDKGSDQCQDKQTTLPLIVIGRNAGDAENVSGCTAHDKERDSDACPAARSIPPLIVIGRNEGDCEAFSKAQL